jgi:5'-deoxynucleotidase YfbR-like HD superfamily hydrolase
LDDIFRLKKIKRSGWSAKRRRVCNLESVGSHTFGGLIIIEFFFPETVSLEAVGLGRDYSKEEIIRLFLIHDWAEAIVGDLLPDEKNENSIFQEESAFTLMGASFIYSSFANKSIKELWLEFERGDSINEKLARDVDLLDNLLQLLIEAKNDCESIPDMNEWIEYIRNRVRTELGKKILKFMLGADEDWDTPDVSPPFIRQS